MMRTVIIIGIIVLQLSDNNAGRLVGVSKEQ